MNVVKWLNERRTKNLKKTGLVYAENIMDLLAKNNQVSDKTDSYSPYVYSFKNYKVEIRFRRNGLVLIKLSQGQDFAFHVSLDSDTQKHYVLADDLPDYEGFIMYLKTNKMTLEDLFS